MSTATTPLLIGVAPNGARRTKSDHEALPITAAEVATTAARCRLAGAGLLHLHVRDEQGAHSLSAPLYREAIRQVRRMAGAELLVQITTESCGLFDPLQQIAAVRGASPEVASFALRELFSNGVVSQAVAEFFAWELGRGLSAQYILCEPAEIAFLQSLVESGLLPVDQPHGLFVLGRYAQDQQADPAELDEFLAAWPAQWPWSACAFGRAELPVAERVIALGGHVRVGFENSLEQPDGSLLESPEARVAQVAQLAAAAGRPLASPEQVRALFRTRQA
ncbi:MAG: 3-keto-5-aminohexanoate cleavage protein [Proteobacteria bacterium]|nr:3-keto-5-aminohexanoate cleavage protein [Pseudomonadota bacterium]